MVAEAGVKARAATGTDTLAWAPNKTTGGTHRLDHSPCKNPFGAVQGEVGLWGQEKHPKLPQQGSVGHRADRA